MAYSVDNSRPAKQSHRGFVNGTLPVLDAFEARLRHVASRRHPSLIPPRLNHPPKFRPSTLK